MLVIPAIDIRHGKCVRLYQGREDRETVYANDPVEMALRWVAAGAPRLHLADLDGAFNGKPANLNQLKEMIKRVKVPIQIGGGYRSFADMAAAIDAGADRVILGTAAVTNPALVEQALDQFGASIAVSIDVAQDFVAVAGWKEVSAVRFDDLARRLAQQGVKHLLFTDTRKDGTLSGPNIDGIRRFLEAASGVPVTVSGGISCLQDVLQLKPFEAQGLESVVVGKALYDNKLSLEEAIKAVAHG